MQIDYDPQADTMYIQLRQGQVDDTLEINKYIYVDVDEDAVPLGIEILFTQRVLGQIDLASITVNISHPTELVSSLGPAR
jgi:uncharacterized protein YuzE